MSSLRRFLLLTSLPLIALVGLAAAGIGYDGTRHEAEEVFDAQMVQYARLLAHTLPPGEVPFDESGVAAGAPELDRTELDRAYATGHEYETRLTFQYWVGDRLVARSRYAPELPRDHSGRGFDSIERDGREWRVFTLDLGDRRRVIVAEDEDVRDEIALALAAQALLPLLIGLPILAILLSLVINLAIRRVDAIAGDVAARNPSDLSPVATDEAPRELTRLLDSINGLLERLRAGIEREKQFSADAAHELRTPITGIRIHLQNALQAAHDDELRQSLQQAELGIARMSHIVEQLLRFNRAVNREEPTGARMVDLEAVLDEVIETQRPLLERRGQRLSTALVPARVTGNHELLAIVFGNLLGNAGQYAPAGGEIAIAIERGGDVARVVVEDSGPGIAAGERERAFSRFHRGNGEDEPAAQAGCGLGLAIAERICERHGATIALDRSETLGGLRATVSFPLARAG